MLCQVRKVNYPAIRVIMPIRTLLSRFFIHFTQISMIKNSYLGNFLTFNIERIQSFWTGGFLNWSWALSKVLFWNLPLVKGFLILYMNLRLILAKRVPYNLYKEIKQPKARVKMYYGAYTNHVVNFWFIGPPCIGKIIMALTLYPPPPKKNKK